MNLPILLVAAVLGACAPRTGAPAGAPVADPEAAAAELQRATVPDGPRQATFAWTMDEAGSRLRGRGVARFEAPERLRLDLFGARGETYLSAALVGDDFRVPAGLSGAIELPSPAMLWGAIGVVRPPTGARLLTAMGGDNGITLRYQHGDDTFDYEAAGDPLRVVRISRAGRGGVRETLVLSWSAAGDLQSSRYRDISAYRELVFTVEEMAAVAAFSPAIWTPDGTAR